MSGFVKHIVQVAGKTGNSERDILKYILTREMQTRHQARINWRTKEWPWGETLTNVYTKEFRFMWTITSANNEYGLQVSIPGVTDTVSDYVQAAIDYTAGSSTGGYRKPNGAQLALHDADWHQGGGKGCGKKGEGTKRKHNNVPSHLLNLSTAQLESWMICPS